MLDKTEWTAFWQAIIHSLLDLKSMGSLLRCAPTSLWPVAQCLYPALWGPQLRWSFQSHFEHAASAGSQDTCPCRNPPLTHLVLLQASCISSVSCFANQSFPNPALYKCPVHVDVCFVHSCDTICCLTAGKSTTDSTYSIACCGS